MNYFIFHQKLFKLAEGKSPLFVRNVRERQLHVVVLFGYLVANSRYWCGNGTSALYVGESWPCIISRLKKAHANWILSRLTNITVLPESIILPHANWILSQLNQIYHEPLKNTENCSVPSYLLTPSPSFIVAPTRVIWGIGVSYLHEL